MATTRLDSDISAAEGILSDLQSDLERFDSTPANQLWSLEGQISQKIRNLDQILTRMTGNLKGAGDQQGFYQNEVQRLREELECFRANMGQKWKDPEVIGRGLAVGQKANANADETITLMQQDGREMQRQLDVLGDDKKRLEHIAANRQEVVHQTVSAKTRLKRMWWRALFHRVLVWIIFTVLLGLFIFSVWYKWGRKSGSKPEPSPADEPAGSSELRALFFRRHPH
jgi:Fe2+ transport system protein B